MTKVKICGVKTTEIVEVCAQAGADYVGLVFSHTSSRCVSVSQAKNLVIAAKRSGVKSVAVFNHALQSQILDVVECTGIDLIQVHGQIPRVPDYLTCIYASAYPYPVPASARPYRDFILFDHEYPGSGKCLSTEQLPVLQNYSVFLAGGLNHHNVKEAINRVRPYAVDVSSGVESSPGMKCAKRVQEFISKVKEYNHG